METNINTNFLNCRLIYLFLLLTACYLCHCLTLCACMYVCVCNTPGVEKTAQWLRAVLIEEQGSISCTHICNYSPEGVPGILLSVGLHRYCTQ